MEKRILDAGAPGDISPGATAPGMIVLFGSGETSPSGRKVFEAVFKTLSPAPRLALLETPAGFELNSAQVIGRVGEFLEQRLQNYHPQAQIIPARKRGTPFSPDDPAIAAPLLEADLIFMGPGSPTYAVRQLCDSLAWQYVRARHRLGAPLVLASAAVAAISAHTLPVYEIYKVGADLHWKDGLNLLGDYGLPLVFIPHWNNNDGGEALDTSRCFMGQARFAGLADLLPSDRTVVGIDEKTALTLDLAAGQAQVSGGGGVTLIHTGHRHARRPAGAPPPADLEEVAARRGGHVHHYASGERFPLDQLGRLATARPDDLPAAVWQAALQAAARREAARQAPPPPPTPAAPPPEALALAEARQAARARKDWPAADALRQQIEALGWKVADTPEGFRIEDL